jgi:hypothetical protein
MSTTKTKLRVWTNTGRRFAFPHLNQIISIAVGFECTVYWLGSVRLGRYQVMPEDEFDPACHAFWIWHFRRKQFHESPAAAALAFIESHRGERLCANLDRCTGWPELCALALRLEGKEVPTDRIALLRAAFSMTNMPTTLGLGIEKVALQVFLESSQNWRPLARIVAAQTFRGGAAIRLSATSKLEKIGPTGELKHGDLAEDAFTYKVDTYGRLFGITRQDLVNDDMSILSDVPIVLGNESARTVSDLFFSVLTANAGGFFSATHNNYISGTTANLSTVSLGMAIKLLRTQVDRDGRIIGLLPTTLVVPAAIEGDARQILNSVQLFRDQLSDQQPSGNPFAGLNLTHVVEPRLDATSAADWYLFARPIDAPMLVAFLRGQESPIVEQAPQEADTLGMMIRGYLDFGVSLGDYRAAVKADAP